MKHLRTITLLLGLLLTQLYTYAQAPKYSNEFLAIGVGARALGMSNAYITSVDDVTGGYWNPAGILGVKSDFPLSALALMTSQTPLSLSMQKATGIMIELPHFRQPITRFYSLMRSETYLLKASTLAVILRSSTVKSVILQLLGDLG
jgi:hypothetical protein